MNTTSMEYVICQEKAGKNPLILSEFMGISPNMTHALYVTSTYEFVLAKRLTRRWICMILDK